MAEARLDIVLVDDGRPAQPGQAGAGLGTQPANPPGPNPSPGPGPNPPGPNPSPGPGPGPNPAPNPSPPGPGWMEWAAGKAAAGLETAGAAARNDGMAVFGQAAGAAASALSMIPVAGGALSAGLSALTTVVGAASNTVSAFVERGKQLAEWSPDLAASGARAEFTAMGADIREAQELGPALAALTDANTEAWDQMREMLLPVKKFIVEQLAYILSDWIVPALRTTEEYIRKIWTVIEHLPDLIQQSVLNAREGIPIVLQSIAEDFKRINRVLAERDKDKAETLDAMMEDAFRTLTARGRRPALVNDPPGAGGVP